MTEQTTPPAASRYVMVDAIRTHYWEAGHGDGPPIVLLHAGGYGENAWNSWSRNFAALGANRRVIAPDWLGFGKTDKLRDFGKGNARMMEHMVRFFEVMAIDEADVIGLSMGGTFLVKAMASDAPSPFPVRKMVLVSGGGFSPMNEARQILQEYDGSFEQMRRQLQQVINAPLWEDDEFVRPYHEASLEPGQWEFVSAPRLRAPFAPERGDFGNVDDTPYEKITVPTLLTAGAQDQLREPGYAEAIGQRLPDGEAVVFDPCGHCPNVERADEWNELVVEFLDRS
ncbi:MAG: alpha/beta fold hydrolase [Ilumatobacter sp.]|uniref:alpha/beta fold hydrolase n=1 Tax=Ilumatobacter sp. TaxID=1967498 RepID=UPI00391D9FE9